MLPVRAQPTRTEADAAPKHAKQALCYRQDSNPLSHAGHVTVSNLLMHKSIALEMSRRVRGNS